MNMTQNYEDAYREYFDRLNKLRGKIENLHWTNINNVDYFLKNFDEKELEDYMEQNYAKKKKSDKMLRSLFEYLNSIDGGKDNKDGDLDTPIMNFILVRTMKHQLRTDVREAGEARAEQCECTVS